MTDQLCTADLLLDKIMQDPQQTPHDISHLLKVHNLTRLLARMEGLDETLSRRAECAAVIHDIACPQLRRQYGQAPGHLQEIQGEKMAAAFLEDTELSDADKERIVWMVGHHHSPSLSDEKDFQILLEADYLVNAHESQLPLESIQAAAEHLFQTDSGKKMLAGIYLS